MTKQSKTAALTREKLTGAFWQLYGQKNTEEIHIKDITDLAGYHRSTFYEYFTDIYDLMSQEEQSLIAQIQKEKDNLDQSSSFLFPGLITFYQTNAAHISLLIKHGNMQFLNSLKETIYPLFLDANHLTDSNSTAIFYEFGINGMIMALDYWYNHQEQISLREFLSSLQSIIRNSLLALPEADE